MNFEPPRWMLELPWYRVGRKRRPHPPEKPSSIGSNTVSIAAGMASRSWVSHRQDCSSCKKHHWYSPDVDSMTCAEGSRLFKAWVSSSSYKG